MTIIDRPYHIGQLKEYILVGSLWMWSIFLLKSIFNYFAQLFSSPPGMDAWTQQRGLMILQFSGIQINLSWQNVLHDAHNVDIPP